MPDHPYGDPVHYPFWDAASRGELMVQQCGACGNCQHYGRRSCQNCCSTELSWLQSSGYGSVYSLTRVHGCHPGQDNESYVVALVDLEEGPRLMTRLVHADCRIGDRVKVCWLARDDSPPLPQFEPA